MKPTWITAAFAAVSPAFVDATVSTFSQTGCVTKQSSKSTNKIPTSTKSLTLTFKPKITVVTTSTKTIIPVSTTVTTISTSTSTATEVLTQETDTFTATITNTETESTTTTLILTELTTSNVVVTSTETMTIPASAGFTPLASQLAAQGFTAGTMRKRSAGKRIAQAVDDDDDDDESRLERRASPVLLGPKGPPKQYPAAVNCYRFVQVISTSTVVSTAKTTKTVTATPGTITVTATTVEPTTITDTPIDASTTVTEYTSTTITDIATETTTATSILTSTSTSFAPMASYYAACGSENRVSTISGLGIDSGGSTGSNYDVAGTNAATAYDCCVTCLLSGTCGATYFYGPSNSCYLINRSGTCNPTDPVIQIFTGMSVYTVSNGNCGGATYS